MKSSPTISELKESDAYSKPGDRLYKKALIRPVSIYFTWLFLRLGWSANQITILSLIVGVFATLFLTSPLLWCWVWAWMALQLYNILDSSDGQTARYTNTGSKFGDYLDTAVHIIVESLIFTMMTFGIYRIYNSVLVFAFGISAALCMVMFHVQHLFKKRLIRKPRSKGKRGLDGLPLFKKLSNTTNMVINSILIVTLLDLYVPAIDANIVLADQPMNYRLLLLILCGSVFPLILIRKSLSLRKSVSATD